MGERVGLGQRVASRAFQLMIVCGILGVAAGGCASAVSSRPSSKSTLPHYVLMTPMRDLPQLEHRAKVGGAAVEAEVTSSAVEPTSVRQVGGGGSSSWSPAQSTRPGHRWMIIRAYGTNSSGPTRHWTWAGVRPFWRFGARP